eukprot:887001-Pyramimonas_sp.AAC.1
MGTFGGAEYPTASFSSGNFWSPARQWTQFSYSRPPTAGAHSRRDVRRPCGWLVGAASHNLCRTRSALRSRQWTSATG